MATQKRSESELSLSYCLLYSVCSFVALTHNGGGHMVPLVLTDVRQTSLALTGENPYPPSVR
jgi:hypothetical protein